MTARKIGYSLGPLLSMREVLACAKMADSHRNVDSLWVPESWGRESFATLGAMSQVTTKVRLGTSIISIYSRTPATVAMAATTLDMLSSNRTVMGLGTSTAAIVENWHGLKFEVMDMDGRRVDKVLVTTLGQRAGTPEEGNGKK